MRDLPAELPDPPDEPPDIENACGCGVRGDKVIVHFPPRTLSKRDALVFAAWLVVLAEEQPGQFAWILRAVQNA